jgi:hypothetical protein
MMAFITKSLTLPNALHLAFNGLTPKFSPTTTSPLPSQEAVRSLTDSQIRDHFDQMMRTIQRVPGEWQNHLRSLGAELAMTEKKEAGQDQRGISLENLPRTISYLSQQELTNLVLSFQELYASDPQKAEASMQAFAQRLFLLGGQASQLSSTISKDVSIRANDLDNDKDFENTWQAFELFVFSLMPGASMTRQHREIAQVLWEQGQKQAQRLTKAQTMTVREAIKSEVVKSNSVMVFDVSDYSPKTLSVLAKAIQKQAGKTPDQRTPILLLTNQSTLDLKELKKLPAWDKVFSGNPETYTITGQDLAKKQGGVGVGVEGEGEGEGEVGGGGGIDPTIEINTEEVYAIAKEKARKWFAMRGGSLTKEEGFEFLGSGVKSLAMDLYTTQMIYTDTWGEELNIRILQILSETEVLVITSSNLDRSFHAQKLFMMQQ